MSSATSYINLLAADKSTLDSFISHLLQEVEGGSVDNLELYAKLSGLIKGLEEVKKFSLGFALDDIEKHGGRFEAYGYKLAKKEAGARYDFSNCNHPEWIAYNEKIKEYSDCQKAIESTLKTLKDPIQIMLEDTGEIVQVNPPIKKSTTTIEVKA
jgi:hypothetical protein